VQVGKTRAIDIHPKDRVDAVIQLFESMVDGELDHALEIPMLHKSGGVVMAESEVLETTAQDFGFNEQV